VVVPHGQHRHRPPELPIPGWSASRWYFARSTPCRSCPRRCCRRGRERAAGAWRGWCPRSAAARPAARRSRTRSGATARPAPPTRRGARRERRPRILPARAGTAIPSALRKPLRCTGSGSSVWTRGDVGRAPTRRPVVAPS
jgi:hypothetical protein